MVAGKKTSGFTLIEILLAAAIFSIILILATGTLSWSATYSAKLREMKKTYQSAREIIDDVSKNSRLANGYIGYEGGSDCLKVKKLASDAMESCYNTSEVILMRYSPSNGYTMVELTRSKPERLFVFAGPETEPDYVSALLLLQQKQNLAILYRTYSDDGYNYKIEKLTKNLNDWPSHDMGKFDSNPVTKLVLNDSSLSAFLEFGGYTPSEADKWQQPFVDVRVRVQTLDFNRGSGTEKRYETKTSLITTTETRDYN